MFLRRKSKDAEIPSIIIEYEKKAKTELSTFSPLVSLPLNKEKTTKEKFERQTFLGKGGYAKCYEVKSVTSNLVYACKIIPKQTVLSKPRNKVKLLSEIRIHSSLKSTGVVRFYKCFEDTDFVFILLELCPKLSLKNFLERRKTLTVFEAQFFMFCILLTLRDLHRNNIIHRDIKLGNILLTEKFYPKIADFGLAAQLCHDDERKTTMCGTPNYIAPEILEQNNEGHGKSVDVWSCGVLLYLLSIGVPPFETNSIKITYKKIRFNEYSFPDNFVKSFPKTADLIKKMLCGNPKERLTIEGCLEHSFFDSFKYIMNIVGFKDTDFSQEFSKQNLVFSPKVYNEEIVSLLTLNANSKAPTEEEIIKELQFYYEKKNCDQLDAKSYFEDYIKGSLKNRINLQSFDPDSKFVSVAPERKEQPKVRIAEFQPCISMNNALAADLINDPELEISPKLLIFKCFTIDRFIDYSSKYGYSFSMSLNLDPTTLIRKLQDIYKNKDKEFFEKELDHKKIMSFAKSLTESIGIIFNDESQLVNSGDEYAYLPSLYDEVHTELQKKKSKIKSFDVSRIKEVLKNHMNDRDELNELKTEDVLEGLIDPIQKTLFTFNLKNYPKILKKKILLFNHFKSILCSEEIGIKNFMVWIEKIFISEYGVVFLMSNKNICAFFKDKSQILISLFWKKNEPREPYKTWICYIDKEERKTELIVNLEKDLVHLQVNIPGIWRRLRYTLNFVKNDLN